MHPPVDPSLLALLLATYNKEVKDFFYFPDIVLVGRLRLEPEALRRLVQEGWLQISRADTFGRYYQHTAQTEQLLMAMRGKRRHPAIPKKTTIQPLLFHGPPEG